MSPPPALTSNISIRSAFSSCLFNSNKIFICFDSPWRATMWMGAHPALFRAFNRASPREWKTRVLRMLSALSGSLAYSFIIMCTGVLPSLSREFTSAPFETSRLQISDYIKVTAMCRGEQTFPVPAFSLTRGAHYTRTFTTSGSLCSLIARPSGENPS